MSKALKTIVDVVRKNPVICLATTDGTKPRLRYIKVMDVADDLTLTCATGMNDKKTEQIKANPNVHVIAGYPPAEPDMPNVSIEAVAEIRTDKETREAVWQDWFTEHFSGPDDEAYVVLKLHPQRATLSTGEEVAEFK